MKKLLFLAIGAAVLYRAAKYFNFTMEDIKKLVPKLEKVNDLVTA